MIIHNTKPQSIFEKLRKLKLTSPILVWLVFFKGTFSRTKQRFGIENSQFGSSLLMPFAKMYSHKCILVWISRSSLTSALFCNFVHHQLHIGYLRMRKVTKNKLISNCFACGLECYNHVHWSKSLFSFFSM